MRRLLYNSARYIYNMVRFRFLHSEDAEGNPFPKLSPRYKAWKKSHGYPTTIGYLSGDMLRAIDTEPQFSNIGFVYGAKLDRMEYPVYFSEGTSKMPSRPIMEVTSEDEDKMLALLETEIYRLLENTK